MWCVKFNKKYIKKEFYKAANAKKIHGMRGKSQHTICGLANEIDEEFEGQTNCPDCIDFIKSIQKLKKGIDF
jgi:hypothetical protein